MTTQVPSFNNRDKLSNIRNKSLNPAIQKVNALESNFVAYEGQLSTLNNHINDIQDVVNRDTATLSRVVSELQTAEQDLRNTFTYATVDGLNKLIKFAHKHPSGAEQGQFELDMSSMFAGTSEAGVIVSNEHEQLRGVNNAIEFTGAIVSKDPANPRKAKVTIAGKSSIEGGIWLPAQGEAGKPHLALQQVKGVTVKGNLGESNWKDGRLEIDLPHLTVRDDVGLGITDVESIRFAGANVTKDRNTKNGIIVDTTATVSIKKEGDENSHPLTLVQLPADSLSVIKNSSGGTSQEVTISQMRATILGNSSGQNQPIDKICIEDAELAYLSSGTGANTELHFKRPNVKVISDEEASDKAEGTTLKFPGAVISQEDGGVVRVHGLRGAEVTENGATKGDVDTLNFEESFQYFKPNVGAKDANVLTIKPMTIKDSGSGSEHNIRGFKVEGVNSGLYVDDQKYLKLTDIVRDGFSAQQLLLNISHDGDVIPEIKTNEQNKQTIAFNFNPPKFNPAIIKALAGNAQGPIGSTGPQVLKSGNDIGFNTIVNTDGKVTGVSAYLAKDAVVNIIDSHIDSSRSNVSVGTSGGGAGVDKKLTLKTEFNATVEGDESQTDKPFDDIHVAMPGSTVLGKILTIRGLTAEDSNGNDIDFDADGDTNPHKVVGRLKAGAGITFTASTDPQDKKAGVMTISSSGGSGSLKGRVGDSTEQNVITKVWAENAEWADDRETLKIKGITATIGGNSQMVKSIVVDRRATDSSINANGQLSIGTNTSGVTISGKGSDGSDITQNKTTRITYGSMFAIGTSGDGSSKEASISFNKKKLAEVLYSVDDTNTILKAGTGITLGINNGKIIITNSGQGSGGETPAADNKVNVSGTNYGKYASDGTVPTTSVSQETPKIEFGKEFDTEVVTVDSVSTIKVELSGLLTNEHYSILTTPPICEYTQEAASGRKKMPYTMLLQDPKANLKMNESGHFTVVKDGIYDLTVCAQIIGDKTLFTNLSNATIRLIEAGGSGDTPVGEPVAIKIKDNPQSDALPKGALHTFTQELVSNKYYYVEVQFSDIEFDTSGGNKPFTPAHMNYLVIEPRVSETKTGFNLAASNRALMSGLLLTPGYAVATSATTSSNAKAKVTAYNTEVVRKTASFEE